MTSSDKAACYRCHQYNGGQSPPQKSLPASILIMDKRAKSEQFRKRKNNFFRRGFDIGDTCETEMFIMFKRKGKFYGCTNTNEAVWPTQEDVERNLVNFKTAADYKATPRRRKKASRPKENTSSPPKTSGSVTTGSSLGIETPESPQLDLSSQRGVAGWKNFFTSLIQ